MLLSTCAWGAVGGGWDGGGWGWGLCLTSSQTCQPTKPQLVLKVILLLTARLADNIISLSNTCPSFSYAAQRTVHSHFCTLVCTLSTTLQHYNGVLLCVPQLADLHTCAHVVQRLYLLYGISILRRSPCRLCAYGRNCVVALGAQGTMNWRWKIRSLLLLSALPSSSAIP